MQVMEILRRKGRAVVSLPLNADLAAAAALLAQKRIGALVIKDAGDTIAGMLSERDVVRAMAEEGPHALGRPVSHYMTKPVTTCVETDTVEAIMELMTKGRFRHAPVLDELGRLCGLVSMGDVVKTHLEEIAREASDLRQYIST